MRRRLPPFHRRKQSLPGESIINSKFHSDADGKVQTVYQTKLPQAEPGLRQVAHESDPANPTSITVATQPIRSLKPPFLIDHVGWIPGHPEAEAVTYLTWFLESFNLFHGRYPSPSMRAPGRRKMRRLVYFQSLRQQQQRPAGFQRLHSHSVPDSFHRERRHRGIRRRSILHIPYTADKAYHFEFLVDMDKHTWSLKVDGDEKAPQTAFPESMVNNGECKLTGLISSLPGPTLLTLRWAARLFLAI